MYDRSLFYYFYLSFVPFIMTPHSADHLWKSYEKVPVVQSQSREIPDPGNLRDIPIPHQDIVFKELPEGK
jgi:hypothetical protein